VAGNAESWFTPWVPPEPKQPGKFCEYALEIRYWSQGDDEHPSEKVAARGPRHAHDTIDRHIVQECLEQGLPIPPRILRRRARARAANDEQSEFAFPPLAAPRLSHPVLIDIDVVNWAKKPPTDVHLLNPPQGPRKQAKLSKQMKAMLESLERLWESSEDEWVCSPVKFGHLWADRRHRGPAEDSLVERGLIEKDVRPNGTYVRWTGLPWR
jgi:hypothetical protein